MIESYLNYNPILFLDFDGVLHPDHDQAEHLFDGIPLFEEVMREFPSLDIVISSSWREVHPLDEMQEYFSPDVGSRIVGITPIRPGPEEVPGPLWAYVREGECAVWIARYRRSASWLALDDAAWRFQPHCKRLLLVDGTTGLTVSTVEALRARLRFMLTGLAEGSPGPIDASRLQKQ